MHLIAPFSQYLEMIVDASVLVIFCLSVNFIFSFRPLTLNLTLRNKLNEELQQRSHEKLNRSRRNNECYVAQLKESNEKLNAISVSTWGMLLL